jgi:hypothetical protein
VERLIIVMIVGIAALGSASAAAAQGRDPADRGLRLELDQLRNDVSQDRLRKPQDTGLLPQSEQNPSTSPDRKIKRSKRQN